MISILTALVLLGAPANAEVRQIELTHNKSQLLDMPAYKRTSITNPDVANVVVVSDRQLLINGNRTGTTNLIVWLKAGSTMVFNITVSSDTDLIKRRLDELIPRNRINVSGAGDLIILSGDVDDISHIEQAVAIAESLASRPANAKDGQRARKEDRPKVVNLINVASLQQVMVDVTIAEVSREDVKELGLNAQYRGNDAFGLSNLGGVNAPSGAVPAANLGGPAPNLSLSGAVGVMFGIPELDLTSFLRALKGNGLVKILAEPTLVSVSGQKASFLAGGEFPVPVQQNTNAVTIEFREFGVRLNITPTVLGSDKISLRVNPEVSALDFQTAIQVGNLSIPGLKSRKVNTTVELASGQSFAVAGLINEELTTQVDKFPLLGDIPILGALFRSSRFRNRETELLIVVTPRLVRPLAVGQRPNLPGDGMRAPTDFELFLMGKTFGETAARTLGPWGFEK